MSLDHISLKHTFQHNSYILFYYARIPLFYNFFTASSIPVTPVTSLGSSLQRKPPVTLGHNTVPIQPKTGGAPISVPQPKTVQATQSELLRRFTENIKVIAVESVEFPVAQFS